MALRVLAARAASSLRLTTSLRHPPTSFLRCFSSFHFPEELKYTKSHEWVKAEGDQATVGITSFALDQLGDIVYVELPEVGRNVSRGESFCVVESVKASGSVYAPVGGEVIEVNKPIVEKPEKLKDDPHGESWLVKLKLRDQADLDALLDSSSYKKVVEADQH